MSKNSGVSKGNGVQFCRSSLSVISSVAFLISHLRGNIEDGFGWPSHCVRRDAKWLKRLSCCHGNCMKRGTIIQP
jgi:hypothetical protein